MKSYQFQKNSKKLLPYVFLCGLILLFTYGAPYTGGDLRLMSSLGEGGFGAWIKEAGTSGGNFFSAFLGGVMVDVPVLRHFFTAIMLSAALITLVSFSLADRPYMYFIVLFLGLAAPKAIFAYSFTGVIYGATVLIPAFLTVMYLFTVSDLFVYKGNKKAWKIPFLFLSGISVQLFSESIGITLLAISLLCLVLLWKKYGFSWHLAAHSFGCLLGLILSLILSGTRDAFVSDFYSILDQMSVALDGLFVENLLLIGLLTLGCLLLMRPVRLERSKNCNITLALLLIPMGLFLFLNVMNNVLIAFSMIYRAATVVKLISVIVYCLGILRTVQHYVSKDKIICRITYSVYAVWICVAVYAFTGTALPHILYIPYLLLVGCTVLLLGYYFRHLGSSEKALRKPLLIASFAAVVALSVITISNGRYYEVKDTVIRESLEEGTTDISLPVAPFEKRLAPTDISVLSEYYDFPSYGDVEISYVSFADWDWITYYEAHNVPPIEEYDEEAVKTEDWAFEFEEDE